MLPSWCPDWTIMRGRRILLWPNEYQACGSTKKAQAVIKEGVLILVGLQVAHVQVLESFSIERFKDSKSLYDALHSIQEKFRNRPHLDLNEASRLDAFRRTIVASRIRFDGPQGSTTNLSEH
jgi:uncharacterized protein YcbK (DUF882 family)